MINSRKYLASVCLLANVNAFAFEITPYEPVFDADGKLVTEITCAYKAGKRMQIAVFRPHEDGVVLKYGKEVRKPVGRSSNIMSVTYLFYDSLRTMAWTIEDNGKKATVAHLSYDETYSYTYDCSITD